MSFAYLAICLGVVLWGCGDDAPLSQPTGPVDNTAQSGSFSLDYVSSVKELVRKMSDVVTDLNNLLRIWEATSNVDYASTETSGLLLQVDSLSRQFSTLVPPSGYGTVHEAFQGMLQALKNSLFAMGRYFASEGGDKDALLEANIQLVEYNKERERYIAAI